MNSVYVLGDSQARRCTPLVPSANVFAYGGRTTQKLLQRPEWMADGAFRGAETVLLFAGSCDVLKRLPITQTVQNMRRIVSHLRSKASRLIVLSVPNASKMNSFHRRELNEELKKMVRNEFGAEFVTTAGVKMQRDKVHVLRWHLQKKLRSCLRPRGHPRR